MYTSGTRKKKNSIFQVGSFIRSQKSKKEKAVEDCGKINILPVNMELMVNDENTKEKEKELKAKEERLRRLEMKVMVIL